MTTTLYLGKSADYAVYQHVNDSGNMALTVIPSAGYNQKATGTFQYNIYVSAIFDNTHAYDGVARLYVGSQLNLSSPGWFLTAQRLGEWPFQNVGAGAICVPPPAIPPIDNIAWALVRSGALPVWTPSVDSPQIAGKRFALVATIEYSPSTSTTQTNTAGSL